MSEPLHIRFHFKDGSKIVVTGDPGQDFDTFHALIELEGEAFIRLGSCLIAKSEIQYLYQVDLV